MPKAPIGALVSIYYDGAQLVQPGDALESFNWKREPTGRVYLVREVRVQQRGAHVGRQHLKCIVGTCESEVAGTMHPIYWYPRGRTARR